MRTQLGKLAIGLSADGGVTLKGLGGEELHALFYRILKAYSPGLASNIHNQDGLKPFSLTPPLEYYESKTGCTVISPRSILIFYLNILTEELLKTSIVALFSILQNDNILRLARKPVVLTNLELCKDSFSSFNSIISETSLSNLIALEFVSPTSFRKNEAQALFPDPSLVFSSLARRWNTYSDQKISEECINLFPSIKVSRYSLHTTLVHFSRYKIIGFTGKVEYELPKDISEGVIREINALANLAPRTAEGYESIVHCHLIPSLGQIPLTHLKPEHLQHVYSEKLSAGFSHRTVRYIHVTLRKALHDAVRLGIILRNPADTVGPPKVQRHEMRTINESDINIFLEFAKSTPNYALFYTALFTGMRRSELLALRWSDVDLILCQLSVTRALHQLQDGSRIFRQPKTAEGRRLISLSPSTAIVLREHREQQQKMRQAIGLTLAEDDLVFCHVDGKPLLPNTVSHAWTKLANRAGLKGIRLHDARHTHASLMLKQGVHPKIVQERLGHASIQITLDTYSHVAPGLQQAAANRFDDIVLPKNQDNSENETKEILR